MRHSLPRACTCSNMPAPATRTQLRPHPTPQVLLSDLGELGSRVLEAVKGLAVALCTAHGGYVVEATEGLCLAAFHDPAAAACWALDCVDNVKMQVGAGGCRYTSGAE